MTETRKQIIELIEPYMDKTLSFGCLVNVKQYGAVFEIIENTDDVIVREKTGYTYDFANDYSYGEVNIKNVIGHYDITAVLKYMQHKRCKIDTTYNQFIFYEWKFSDYGKCYGSVENKPLHLYTEKEEKDLLELLLKIK